MPQDKQNACLVLGRSYKLRPVRGFFVAAAGLPRLVAHRTNNLQAICNIKYNQKLYF
jgi:hypothetical protein